MFSCCLKIVIRGGEHYCLFGVVFMDSEFERLGRLSPEVKVALALDLSDGCVRVCADGIRALCPGIREEELLARLRERLLWGKRRR
jgi:hypothetical protein